MKYSIVIHKDTDSDYGVTFPDLPGCFSAGDSFEQALEMAQEAAELHLEGLIEEGAGIPQPAPIEQHMQNPDYQGGVWAVVDVDLSKLSGKARRVNITLPERVLTSIDDYAVRHGGNRSKLLADAALRYIAGQS